MSKIEWLKQKDGLQGKTWNPVTGCSKISPGCDHCYAERMAKRLKGRYGYPADDPFKVTLHPDRLDQPLHWRKPKTIFVCSMGDLFHEDVPFMFVARIFNTAMRCHYEGKRHTFIFLTKRPTRMATFFREAGQADTMYGFPLNRSQRWTASLSPNIWLGVTAENQEQANKRIPMLLEIPAAKRFVSIEPMLGPVELDNLKSVDGDVTVTLDALTGDTVFEDSNSMDAYVPGNEENGYPSLDWVIVGCESGPGRRYCEYDWMLQVVEDCRSAEVPVFVKQVEINGRVDKDLSHFPPDLQVRQRPGAA